MDAANCEQACSLVSKSYISQGQQALAKRHRLIKTLLSSRRLPEQGWDEPTIEAFVQDCALMDSNNFLDNVGAGEREGRVACPLVARQHYHLAHGIGRSGDIAAEQPKAAGSSLLAKMTMLLATDALRVAGLQDLGSVTVLPLATGMAMTMTLLAIKAGRPRDARYVIWSRIDQKTCLKAITAAGLEPVVVELQQRGDELCTDVQAIEQGIERLGSDAIAAVVTTTSCFAPRASDDVVAVARLCATSGVPHLINNAYGIQSSSICRDITAAWRKGRVDAFVSSTDKNFMVPVGGALVAEGSKLRGLVAAVNKTYPGRASVSVHLDLLMTLLHWGSQGWQKVLKEREELYPHMKQVLEGVASRHGQRVLHTPGNPISLAMTLDQGALEQLQDYTFIGSMLWARCVSGTRVVPKAKQQTVAGIPFTGYGSHTSAYPHVYMTAAAALGGSTSEADVFGARVDKCLLEVVAKAGGTVNGGNKQECMNS
ncbi:selenocysteine synthase [Dunaliella salina]|uniref:O-phosphoseryl-tRNA(Sec) selenium transferase n=1 Tax=Dunaliella salina TaxID=3046 RepID=A0ABQ7G896_DUNSA|nr:selenocysteine synthase [Dunaliella salina]|eukprot:KAF5830836.1 selenocysteine synthase [Dunaliella salina]